MKGKCADCEYLDKTKKMEYSKNYLYGCKLRETGYVSTWINTDNTLKHISCSVEISDDDESEEDMPIEETGQLQGQMNIFDFIICND